MKPVTSPFSSRPLLLSLGVIVASVVVPASGASAQESRSLDRRYASSDRIELRAEPRAAARALSIASRGWEIEPLRPEARPLELRMPEPGPDSFFLRFWLAEGMNVYVTSDLGAGLKRLEALDFETYFSTGAELQLTPTLRLFVEDFQPAGMVLGDDPEDGERVPSRYWDGHQLSVGLRERLAESLDLELAPVFYLLSATRRSENVGVAGSIVWRI